MGGDSERDRCGGGGLEGRRRGMRWRECECVCVGGGGEGEEEN